MLKMIPTESYQSKGNPISFLKRRFHNVNHFNINNCGNITSVNELKYDIKEKSQYNKQNLESSLLNSCDKSKLILGLYNKKDLQKDHEEFLKRQLNKFQNEVEKKFNNFGNIHYIFPRKVNYSYDFNFNLNSNIKSHQKILRNSFRKRNLNEPNIYEIKGLGNKYSNNNSQNILINPDNNINNSPNFFRYPKYHQIKKNYDFPSNLGNLIRKIKIF